MHTTRLRQATPPPLKTIEPGRDEGAARVETTRQPVTRPDHRSLDTRKRFRHDPLADARRSAQPTAPSPKPVEPGHDIPPLKLVEPGRDEGAARVETIRQPNSRPVEEATSYPSYSGDARGSSGAK